MVNIYNIKKIPLRQEYKINPLQQLHLHLKKLRLTESTKSSDISASSKQ
jgi:hypothetical protein